MNGRIYDYNVGRFMSVDPIIQAPANSQSINPYSYIMNNPLSGTDPTGYMGCAASKIDSVCQSTSSHYGGTKEAVTAQQNNISGELSAAGRKAMSNGVKNQQTSKPNSNTKTSDINSQNKENNGTDQDDSRYSSFFGGNLKVDIGGLLNDLDNVFSYFSEPIFEGGVTPTGLCNGRGDCFDLSDGFDESDTKALLGAVLILPGRTSKATQESVSLVRSSAAKIGEEGGLNLFKWADETTLTSKGWKGNDFMLYLPDKGSAKANWKQNSGYLREQMKKGYPIKDSFRDAKTGQQLQTGGFLNAERKLLESRGWKYNSSTSSYHPPSGN